MQDRDLDDEAMAALVRDPASGITCDRSTINRIRRGETWVTRKLAKRFLDVSDGLVTPNDLLQAAE